MVLTYVFVLWSFANIFKKLSLFNKLFPLNLAPSSTGRTSLFILNRGCSPRLIWMSANQPWSVLSWYFYNWNDWSRFREYIQIPTPIYYLLKGITLTGKFYYFSPDPLNAKSLFKPGSTAMFTLTSFSMMVWIDSDRILSSHALAILSLALTLEIMIRKNGSGNM